jgi:NaMN:DMB phosphoribosyltransferase
VFELVALAQQVPVPDGPTLEPAADSGWPAPAGLGRLHGLAGWLAGVHRRWPPAEPARPRLLLVQPGQTADPAVAEVAALVGIEVAVLPAGTDRAGTIDQPAAAGAAAADQAADEGVDVLVVAGIGADVAATTVLAALTGLEPAAAVSAGDDAAWRRDVVAVRDLLRRARPHADSPAELLSSMGSPVLGALAGLVLQAPVRRTPVVLDGLAACAAASVAYRLAPHATHWWLAADRTGSPAQQAALDLLRLRPVLDLEAAPGYAGPLVVPLLRAAARLCQLRAQDAAAGTGPGPA